MLFFTGFSRIASEIAGKKIQNLLARERQLMRDAPDGRRRAAILQDDQRRSPRSAGSCTRAGR